LLRVPESFGQKERGGESKKEKEKKEVKSASKSV
jgi:hypothetical protein